MTPSSGRTQHKSRRLSELTPGARGIIRRVSGESRFARRLMELGLVPGTHVELVRRAPMGDPIELLVRGTHFSIRGSEADRIYVDPI
jgi:Fe2+ transport system protein FeoA